MVKRGLLLTLTGLQRYYEYLASRKNAVPIKQQREDTARSNCGNDDEGTPLLNRSETESSGKKKKKKGKGFLRLIEAYSRHVEGLQMIQ